MVLFLVIGLFMDELSMDEVSKFKLHPLIARASGALCLSALRFWNALGVNYSVVCSYIAYRCALH